MYIEVAISNDPVTGLPRKSRMGWIFITEEFEFRIMPKVFKTDIEGVSLFEKAKAMEGTEEQREAAIFANAAVSPNNPFTTEGARVNSATGAITDDGDVPQMEFLNSLSYDQVSAMFGHTGSTSYLEGMKEFIKLMLKDADDRGRT